MDRVPDTRRGSVFFSRDLDQLYGSGTPVARVKYLCPNVRISEVVMAGDSHASGQCLLSGSVFVEWY